MNQEDSLTGFIIKAKEGDLSSFDVLVELYQKDIFRMAYGYFYNREDALEVVQEAFLRAFRSLHRLNEVEKFQSWLFTIANNVARDMYRKRKRTPQVELIENVDYEDSGSADNSTEIESNEMMNILSSLPHKQKTIMVMRYIQNMKFNEIAERLDISIGTVKNQHFKAVNKLKKYKETVLEGHNA